MFFLFLASICDFQGYSSILALGGTRPEDDYNEANKRHTMSHPPERIPDIDDQSPTKIKPPKEIKEKEKKEKIKDKVRHHLFIC